MLNNFIYSKQKSLFEEKLNNGEVLDEAIVFIEDTKEIWNHGTYFGTSLTEDDISTILNDNTFVIDTISWKNGEFGEYTFEVVSNAITEGKEIKLLDGYTLHTPTIEFAGKYARLNVLCLGIEGITKYNYTIDLSEVSYTKEVVEELVTAVDIKLVDGVYTLYKHDSNEAWEYGEGAVAVYDLVNQVYTVGNAYSVFVLEMERYIEYYSNDAHFIVSKIGNEVYYEKTSLLQTDGDGTKYLSNDGNYYQINSSQLNNDAGFITADSIPEEVYVSSTEPEDENIKLWIDTTEETSLETVLVSLSSNQASTDFSNVTVTVTTVEGSESQQYSGASLTFHVKADNEYTISVSDIDNYKTPESYEGVAIKDNIVNVTFTYNATLITVELLSNQADTTDIASATATVNGTTISSGGSVLVPIDSSVTITFSEVEGYKTPDSQTFIAAGASISKSGTYIKIIYIDLSMIDIHGVTQSTRTTANCYVVKTAGDYKFPLVYGNAIKDGTTNSAAYTKIEGEYSHDFVNYKGVAITSPYIEIDTGESVASAQLSIADEDNLFTDISIIKGDDCNYVQFTVTSIPASGANGVISVLNAEGTIMWSWHIWVWADDLTPVTITNSTGIDYDILPVNLASKWETDSSNPTQIKNWYYQWGRPNPMLLSTAYNSNTDATSYGALSFTRTANAGGGYEQGITNPANFWYSESTNWYGDTTFHYNLWDANCTEVGSSDNITVKTIYDPSPRGFKVCNANTFTSFSKDSIVGSFTNGYYFKKNDSDTTGIFFPASGCRIATTGNIDEVNETGFVTTTSIWQQGLAYCLVFTDSTVNNDDGSYFLDGDPIRPVAEQ